MPIEGRTGDTEFTAKITDHGAGSNGRRNIFWEKIAMNTVNRRSGRVILKSPGRHLVARRAAGRHFWRRYVRDGA